MTRVARSSAASLFCTNITRASTPPSSAAAPSSTAVSSYCGRPPLDNMEYSVFARRVLRHSVSVRCPSVYVDEYLIVTVISFSSDRGAQHVQLHQVSAPLPPRERPARAHPALRRSRHPPPQVCLGVPVPQAALQQDEEEAHMRVAEEQRRDVTARR